MLGFDIVDLVALSVIQGVTEFLPISSSAHAVLFSAFFGEARHALSLDAALHGGTLIALLVCFRKDWIKMAKGAFAPSSQKAAATREDRRLLSRVIIASLPLFLLGALVLATNSSEQLPRTPLVIAIASVLFALLLLLADRFNKGNSTTPRIENLSVSACLFVGALQCCALLPGASRAGVVMTAALLCGLGRRESARLAVLTSLPALAGASVFGVQAIVRANDPQLILESLFAAALAAVVAGATLRWFMRAVARIGFLPFVLYRCALAALILVALALA